MEGIKKIKISNFKSFNDCEINFNEFNVIIGENSVGKSNLAEAIKFAKNIINFDHKTALLMSGGLNLTLNSLIGSKKPLKIEIESENKVFLGDDGYTHTKLMKYSFELKTIKKGNNFSFEEIAEILINDGSKISIINKDQKISIEENITKSKNDLKKYGALVLLGILGNPKNNYSRPYENLFMHPYINTAFTPIKDFLNSLFVFNFNPFLAKKANHITGETHLKNDGSNLSEIVLNLLEKSETKYPFLENINMLTNKIANVKPIYFQDGSVILGVREKNSKKYMPCNILSDGTINILCLAAALCDPKISFIILEEPEKNIHPNLMHNLVEFLKEQKNNSNKKQILITTHNPELISRIQYNNAWIMYRDKNNFTKIEMVAQNKWIIDKIENGMFTFEEIFRQELWK